MPHLPVEEKLAGITGLLNYRQDTAKPIRELTEILLRGPSTLTEAEREMIATVTSYGNQCEFCTNAHSATVDTYLGEHETSHLIKTDLDHAPVSEKMKSLLRIAKANTNKGRHVTDELVAEARAKGATDTEIHDTILISALFSLYNRYVDGAATLVPQEPVFYDRLAGILVKSGYLPSENRYAALEGEKANA